MSIPQAIPSVQVIPDWSAWRDNSTRPLVCPVPHILVASAQATWHDRVPPPAVSRTPATVRVNGIMLFQETVQSLGQASWFVRFATVWLRERVSRSSPKFDEAFSTSETISLLVAHDLR
jgi:hypothetical protein